MRRRYTTKRLDCGRVELRVHVFCWLGEAGEVRTFWAPDRERDERHGYLREEFGDRQGTLGLQVCDGLTHRGDTLLGSQRSLLDLVRYEAQACLRSQAREEERYG